MCMNAVKTLKTSTEVKVRFSEVDSLGMVWHGNYVQYLEDAREKFGHSFGLEYLKIYALGYITPMFDLQIRYRHPARVDDILCVEIAYAPQRGAKIIYDYTITRPSDGMVILEARSIQLFQTKEGEFVVSKPDFIREWEEDNGISFAQSGLSHGITK